MTPLSSPNKIHTNINICRTKARNLDFPGHMEMYVPINSGQYTLNEPIFKFANDKQLVVCKSD